MSADKDALSAEITERWRAQRRDRQRRRVRLSRLLRVCGGRPYRLVMRTAHWFGFCFPETMWPDGDEVAWCTWCGLRGRP